MNSVLPGETHYAWLTEGDTVNVEELDRALRVLVKQPGFAAAVNAELSYAGNMLFYLRESRRRAERLLDQLDREYPR